MVAVSVTGGTIGDSLELLQTITNLVNTGPGTHNVIVDNGLNATATPDDAVRLQTNSASSGENRSRRDLTALNNDFQTSKRFLVVNWKMQNINTSRGVETFANHGFFFEIHENGDGSGGVAKYRLGGQDSVLPAEGYKLMVLNVNQVVTASSSSGTIDEANLGSCSLGMTGTFLQGNGNTVWARIAGFVPYILIGGDGASADGTLQDIVDSERLPAAPATDGLARAQALQGAGQWLLVGEYRIGDGATATEFTESGIGIQFGEQAETIATVAVNHILENDFGWVIDAGASDICNLTDMQFSSLTKYRFVIEGNSGSTQNFLRLLIQGAGEFESLSGTEFDACTISGNDKLVMN